jgi:Mn2+/Fe2+ NRAMP family transporter
MFKKSGPGVLIAAAFIGPGTVTACTLAGVGFGYDLLWAMGLSIVATMVLQEMSARLGLVSGKGLAEVIRAEVRHPAAKVLAITVILSAIVVGNAAYEAGNISGATLGMQAVFGDGGAGYYHYIIGAVAFLLLYLGNYKVLEKIFITLVVLMSLSFILTAVLTKPNILAILKGLLIPKMPPESILGVMALVGTTIVPYNLFLHASLVNERWNSPKDLKWAQRDTYTAVLLGGVVSLCIIISAAAIEGDSVSNVMDLAMGLEPLYGQSAVLLMGIGLFAAGVTSAITAPLAAAYVAKSCFGWQDDLKSFRFRLVWMVVLFIGVFGLSFDVRPIEVITFAQVANGILLPFIAIFLFWVVNRTEVLGTLVNGLFKNILGLVIIALAVVLGLKSIIIVVGGW